MRRIFYTGLGLKLLFLLAFYFIDLTIISSGNVSVYRVVRSGQFISLADIPDEILPCFNDFERLDSGVESLMRRYDIKGASIAVAMDGRLVYARGIGYADIEAKEPVNPGHLFRVASVSKLITATAIMKMAELGKLNLDDRVFGTEGILNKDPFLDYSDPRVEQITVRHLLNHSGGWNRRFGDHLFMSHVIAKEMNADLPVTANDIIKFALSKRLHFRPGSGTSYSNLGYVILGEIIETTSGVSYEDYVRQSLFLPLGIQDIKMGRNLLEERFDNEVKYYEQPNALQVISLYNETSMVNKVYGGNDIETLGAAGGWIASPAELLKLIVAIDDQNYVPGILSQESIDIMTDKSLSGGQTIGWTYTDRHGNWWRTGTFAGTSALVLRQNNGLTWAAFFNSSTYKGSTLSREIYREVASGLNRIDNWPDHDLFFNYGANQLFQPDIAEFL